MGHYFNPPQQMQQVGRELFGSTYAELTSQLLEGEVLFGLYDRVFFMNCPHLFSEAEFNEFESQVLVGVITRVGFFAHKEQISE